MDIRFKDNIENRMNVNIEPECNTIEIANLKDFKGWNSIILDDEQIKNLYEFLKKVVEKNND